jgi:RNA polymerase sigma factor (sigma-70 family)
VSLRDQDVSEGEREFSQRLLQRLHGPIAPEEGTSPAERSLAEERRILATRLVDQVRPLRRFVRRELARAVALGTVPPGVLDELELVDTVLVRALQHAREAPQDGLFRWLRRLARRVMRSTVEAERRRLEHERSLDEPVAVLGEEWPDQVVRLIDLLADPTAELPEELLLTQETRSLLDQALDRLPEQWREVFLLRAVDRWDDATIASAEGMPVDQVRSIVEISRAFLAEALRESRESGIL